MVSTSQPIRWGILGTGFIAQKFADGLRSVPEAQLWAVGSRTLASAQKFAHQFNVPKVYGSYSDLVNDPTIDVVYVATPHIYHKENCISSLKARKAVLCEKPFTVNAREAKEVITLAREQKLFCMEAMWMRFMPLIQKVKQIVDRGDIGEIRLFTAEFGYPTQFDPNNRFFKLELGGGALLDRGVYPLSLAFFLFGPPNQISGQACKGNSGVDEQSAMLLTYESSMLAILSSTLNTYGSNSAIITGTRGKIVIHEPFYEPERISLIKFPDSPVVSTAKYCVNSSRLKQKLITLMKRNLLVKSLVSKLRYPTTTFSHANESNGLSYQAVEVVRCLKNGERESPIMPLDHTLKIMETMDVLRQQWNLKYPQDID
ncbi:dehydrogenase [Hydrococcus rivularis NIES-593]|uniref:Dehydrogenase n=1 Tax=Hydrococcus rivularis NIES-593 TaxID=1921803 RepID=A0A1U7HBL2_9CYAN|nr:Gfo/Idh/MocA family oxidoreductase [Hydrococcus rivularis]OKH20963.1 dehydrogenase [Hydrococcus rivularis NIES-593]